MNVEFELILAELKTIRDAKFSIRNVFAYFSV